MKKLIIIVALMVSTMAMASTAVAPATTASAAITAPKLACVIKRTATGKIARSTTQVNHFKVANPCPTNGATKGSCPGYVVDHIVPLCGCGSDTPTNMQWQTLADSKVKDVQERKLCSGK